MPPPPFTALVLAGSRGPEDAVAKAANVSHKALARVAGTAMLERVLAALAGSASIGRVIVQCERGDIADGLPSAEALRAQGRLSALGTSSSPALSVAKALAEIVDPYPLLVTTADHPLLRPDMIEYFIDGARQRRGTHDVAVGLAPASVVLAKYPGALRTFYRLGGERWSGCNLFALLGPEAVRAVNYWVRLERFRKQPWRLIAEIGPRALALYALNRLDLDAAMVQLSRIIGCRGAAIAMPFAEAPIDVDKAEDLALVETILTQRSA